MNINRHSRLNHSISVHSARILLTATLAWSLSACGGSDESVALEAEEFTTTLVTQTESTAPSTTDSPTSTVVSTTTPAPTTTTPTTTEATTTTTTTTAPPTTTTTTTTTTAPARSCPDNTLLPTLIGYQYLDNGGIRLNVRWANSCQYPQVPVRGDFDARYTYPDGSTTVLARSAGFVFDGSSGGPVIPSVPPGGSVEWSLSWGRLEKGFDFFRNPAIDIARVAIGYRFSTRVAD
jgi:hypothetical protein